MTHRMANLDLAKTYLAEIVKVVPDAIIIEDGIEQYFVRKSDHDNLKWLLKHFKRKKFEAENIIKSCDDGIRNVSLELGGEYIKDLL